MRTELEVTHRDNALGTTAMRPRKWQAVLAALLSSALPDVALAQGSFVQIYGTLNTDLEYVQASGARGGLPGQMRLSSNLSNIGFRGSEDLGDGLKAVWQVESGISLDTGNGNLGGRNSNVGLDYAPLGLIFYGIWETPYKTATSVPLDPFFTNTIAGANSILGNGFAAGANGAAPQSFDRRQFNSVAYWTPNWNGLYARIQYGTERAEPSLATINSFMVSGSVAYENGPLYLVLAGENHYEYFGPNTNDYGIKGGIGYTLGPVRLRGVVEYLRFEPTASTNLSRVAWQLAGTYNLGKGQFRLSYIHANNAQGNATVSLGGIGSPVSGLETSANQVSAGYGYFFSKRTEVYAIATYLSNGAGAVYNLSTNPLAGLTQGQHPMGFGLGIKHSF